MAVVKRYSNGEITVVWKPDVCIHSEKCFHGLPAVFDPRRRPWVQVDAATTDAIITQVDRCPSGALSWERDAPGQSSRGEVPSAPPTQAGQEPTAVSASPNGPLMVAGALVVTLPDGTTVSRTRMTAFCRCGHSNRKPFCDGSHARVGFVG